MQWVLPYGAPSAAPWIAMFAQAHFDRYGTTREQLAQIALNARKNAALNPKAIYTDPMSMDDYLAARMISTPLCLFDCDVPCDGGTAVIVSRADTAPDLRKPPIQVEAVGTAIHGRPSWDQWDDLATMACRDAGEMLWKRTDLKPSDVQLAEMYDGFSFITLAWLEAMGFCGKGESGAFIEGGANIALDGVCCRSTPTAASSRAAASTGSASSTRPACSSGARPAPARYPAPPRSASPAPAAAPSAAPSSSPTTANRAAPDTRSRSFWRHFAPL